MRSYTYRYYKNISASYRFNLHNIITVVPYSKVAPISRELADMAHKQLLNASSKGDLEEVTRLIRGLGAKVKEIDEIDEVIFLILLDYFLHLPQYTAIIV